MNENQTKPNLTTTKMSTRRQQVLDILKSLKPFSQDGGKSCKVVETFDFDDWEVVNEIVDSWLGSRPSVGDKLYGFEAVCLPDETRVSIISPWGNVYAAVPNY